MYRIEALLRLIPRPERSGWKAVLLGVLFLVWFFSPIGVGGGDGSVCGITPWLKRCQKEDESGERRYRVNYILMSPNGRGKKPCTCHLDVRFFGKPIEHLHSLSEESCDSDHYVSQEWIEPREIKPLNKEIILNSYGFLIETKDGIRTINRGDGEYRLHCDDQEEVGANAPH